MPRPLFSRRSFLAKRRGGIGGGGGGGGASRRAVKSGRLAAYTGGRHPYKRRKVIVSRVYCRLRRSASHWQPPRFGWRRRGGKALPSPRCRRRRRAYCAEELNPRSSLLFFFFSHSFLPSFSSGFHEHSPRQWDGAANLGGTAKSETMANNASRAQFLAGLSPSLARQELHGRRSSCQQDLGAATVFEPRENNGWGLNHLGDSPVGSASRRE